MSRCAARPCRSRYGILSTAAQSTVVSTITSTLQQSNVTYNSSWLSIKDLTTGALVGDVSTVPAGDQLQFTLSATYASLPAAVRPLYSMTGQGIGPGKMISATCVMLKE